ncbi:MAG: hypothetical protein H7836_00100 [Magnetococcus sp. YQC-3]
MKKDRAHTASGRNDTPVASPENPPRPERASVAQPPRGRIRKSAQVDEQIFQEGLAISLENEKRLTKNAKQAKPKPVREAGKGDAAIVNEFQTMIDAMLPTTREERVACLSKAERRLAGKEPKAGKDGHGSSDKKRPAARKKGGKKKGGKKRVKSSR